MMIEYERRINELEHQINENDKIYLEYCELLMQAKEEGLGYRVEWKDTLYLVPTPLVKIDETNSFHSETEPAIRWKEGKEFYCRPPALPPFQFGHEARRGPSAPFEQSSFSLGRIHARSINSLPRLIKLNAKEN